MGCCCSSCHCTPDIEPSLTPEELSRQNSSQIKSHGRLAPPARPPIPALPAGVSPISPISPVSPVSPPSLTSRRPKTPEAAQTGSMADDQPPPYESNDRSSILGSRETVDQQIVPASSTSQAVKDLPYVIPLTSSGPTAKAEDSLAAAYAPDLQDLGIPISRYITFLAGLDSGLFARPSAEPGSVSAYIQSMFRDQDGSDLTWRSHTSPGSIDTSQAYVQEANTDLFHKAALHVEVLKTHEMKERIDAASHAELLRARGTSKLDRIEDKRTQEALKLEQRLLTSKTLDKQQKAMRKYLEKDDKYNQKALKAINKYEERIDAESSVQKSRALNTDDGVYWLLVTKYGGQD